MNDTPEGSVRRFSLSDLALDRPISVSMLLVALVCLGLIGLLSMPLSYLPLQVAPRLAVRLTIADVNPEVLERDIIRPLEEQVASVRDLESMRVFSGSWGVHMALEFEPGTDIDARKLELRDRIERVRGDLPNAVRQVDLRSYSNFDDPMLEFRLASETDLAANYDLIDRNIVRPLQRIPGVARVELEGVAPPELEVAMDLDEVAQLGVSIEDVGTLVGEAGVDRSLGTLRSSRTHLGVRGVGVTAAAETLERLPVQSGIDGRSHADGDASVPVDEGESPMVVVPLGSMARVRVRPEEQRRGRRVNGRRAINLSIYGQAGASAVDVSAQVRAEVERIRQNPALGDIDLLVFEDQGQVILKTLGDLRDAGVVGGILGIVVLALFLHRVRTTLAASVSIPLSVLAAGAVLFLRGEELNCVVMLGLVLGVGMLIDNAVVIVEAITRAIQQGASPAQAAREGAREVSFATIASTLSTIIVFIPMMTSDPADQTSAYLRPVGTTFTIGLLASLVVSQTAIPLLMGRWMPPRARPVHNPWLDWFSRGYSVVIATTLKRPRLTVWAGLALALSAYYPYAHTETRLGDAETQPDNFPIRIQTAGSLTYERVEGVIESIEAALLPELGSLPARAISCTYSDHWGNCRVYPEHPFESEAEVEAFHQAIEQRLPEQVGVTYHLGDQQFDWRENKDRHVVSFALRGEDMVTLFHLSEAVADHLRATLPKGSADDPDAGGYDQVTLPFSEGGLEAQVRLDAARLQRFGLRADTVAERIALAFEGRSLGTVRGESGDMRLFLTSQMADDAGAAALRDLELPGTEGPVRLGSVASIEFVPQPQWIQRANRQTEVEMAVRFHSTESAANNAAVEAAMAEFTFPPGYDWGHGTRRRRQTNASNQLLINLALCLLLVYAVMASLFESFLQPLGILITCIMGCFGAFWGLWVTGTTLDTTALIGFFMLIGVVVNNGIMLVDKTTQLRRAGMGREAALRHAGRERLRPILMTVTTTVLGLVPMLIHHPTLAGIYYHAIAIVLAGGLITSTVITLIVLPSMYTVIEGMAGSARRAWQQAFPPHS